MWEKQGKIKFLEFTFFTGKNNFQNVSKYFVQSGGVA